MGSCTALTLSCVLLVLRAGVILAPSASSSVACGVSVCGLVEDAGHGDRTSGLHGAPGQGVEEMPNLQYTEHSVICALVNLSQNSTCPHPCT
jgi:hypothetical protein